MRSLAAVLLICSTLGCASRLQLDETPPDPAVGNYSLATIDGKPLPVALRSASNTQVVAGGIVLQDDKAFGMALTYAAKGKTYSKQFTGVFRREGNRLRLEYETGGRVYGDLEVNRLLVKNDGLLFEFKRATAVVTPPVPMQ